MTLPSVQLQLVRFSTLYKSVTEQRGVGEEHILIIHSMYNQQSVWPAGIMYIHVKLPYHTFVHVQC